MAFLPSHITLVGIASGVLMHLAVFRRGEWDVASPSVFLCYFTVAAAGTLASHLHFHVETPLIAIFFFFHAVGIFTSMLVYRAFFHRLSAFPGPFLARLSNFYITARSMKKLQLFAETEKLHAQYGDYVRVGPRELSIADPEAVKAIYGSQSPCTKGPWYTLLEPRVPLFMARDKQEHARRRKVWDQAFTTKAIAAYDVRITGFINRLLSVIDRHQGQPLDVAQWFAYFVFDVIEDLGFSQSPNMLEDGKEAYIFKTIRADMFNIALFTHLPWLLPFLKRTPLLNRNYLEFWDWIANKVDKRAKNKPAQPDIFGPLLAAYHASPQSLRDRYDLHADAQLIVIAGSDSVAAALTHIFFHLAWDPSLASRLQRELDALPDLSHDRHLAAVPLLDAVINETLRLHPPVPSGTQRETPPGGLWIGRHGGGGEGGGEGKGGVYIPGETIVQVPSHTVFRDERAFARAGEFVPERWTTRPEMVRMREAFVPFNTGPYACIGKRLAMLQMRRVVAEILARYDVAVAPGQTKEGFLGGKQDTFTTVSAPLPLVFTRRVRA
ncbi:hypothetical protein VTK26DRAFT_1031 [Humicola hyalothermophila]